MSTRKSRNRPIPRAGAARPQSDGVPLAAGEPPAMRPPPPDPPAERVGTGRGLPIGRPGGGTRRPPGPRKRKARRPHGLILVKRGNVWWIYGTFRRKHVRRSTFETDRERAEQALSRVMAEMNRDYDAREKPRERTFFEACDAYLAHESRSPGTTADTKRLRDLAGTTILCRSVNQPVLEEWGKALMRHGAKRPSFKRKIRGPANAILNLAAAIWGAGQGCPKPVFVKIPDGQRRTVTVLPHTAELMVALALAKGWHSLAEVIVVALCEGLRRGELFNLDWRFVDPVRRRATLRDTKSERGAQRDRLIGDLRPRTLEALCAAQARTGRTDGPVFLADDGSRFTRVGSFGALMNCQMKALSDELNLPDPITLHNLRHSAASWHYVVEPDLKKVMARMDWRSVSIADRYVHLLPGGSVPEVLAFWRMGSN